MIGVDQELAAAVAALDLPALRARYLEQDEFLFLPSFLPERVLGAWTDELAALRPRVHRNYVPGHKKGGSVDFATLAALAPSIRAVYASPAFLAFLKELTGAPLGYCPESDLHRCAIYAYTEPGDRIGFHYDRSYYRGSRYTVLIGLHDRSSSRLAYRLYTRAEGRANVDGAVETPPGCLIVFNGDRLWHAVTPLGPGEERFIVTMEYVTDARMSPGLRFVSNMKDAIAYFGFRKVFGGRAAGAGG